MSSNDHKKFKTEATQKTSTDTEIISDAVLLPPYSTDHILTVTVGNEGTSSVPVTTTETLTRSYPAQSTMLFYNHPDTWWETTDDVFKSYDFSNGISFYYGGSQGYYHYIDKTNIFNISFTDGSYIKFAPGSNFNVSIEYRDGSNGTVKSFESQSTTLLQYLEASKGMNATDVAGGNGYEQSYNQADTYLKYAASFGPNGYKLTVTGDYDSGAQSLRTFNLTSNNGADWAELDFSSKTVANTKLIYTVDTVSNSPIRIDLLALGRGEITFPSLACAYDLNDATISGGTPAIEDVFSKDYDRFFLFGSGDSDNTQTQANNGTNPPSYPVANIDMKSHGDSAAVSLTFKAGSTGTATNINWIYKSRPDLPNWSNSAGSVQYEATTTTTGTGSNITGQVDVELEMSPDGKNWCPAQTKEATASTEGSGGVSAQNANLKAISTTTTTEDPYKNKFALGSLSYDDNGVQQTVEDSGTKDFMQQFMSKDKPFNYSIWTKTDTAEQAFGDDYTPVIFRHGGKDKFTNLKTVQLTDTATQNLCEPTPTYSNNYALASIGTTSKYTAVASTSTYGLVGTNSTYNMPLQTVTFDRDWSMTCRFFVPANTNSDVANTVYFLAQRTNAQAHRFVFALTPYVSNSWRGTLGVGFGTGAGSYGIPWASANTNNTNWATGTRDTANDNWYLVSLVYTAGTGITCRVIRESDGTVELDRTQLNGAADIDWSNQSTPMASNTLVVPTSGSTALWSTKVDQYVFYDKALSLTELQELIANNQINDPLATSFASNIISYRRFGDGPNDVFSSSVVDVMGNAQDVNVTSGVFEQLSDTDSGYTLGLSNNQSIFSASTPFSISGWFRTTDTGTLFSNGTTIQLGNGTGVAGLTCVVASDGEIELITFSSTNGSIIRNTNTVVNDGEWHHIVVTKDTSNAFSIYIDGVSTTTPQSASLVDDDLRGDNLFTLLSDGQNNANNATPSSTDASKLQASLSNWSLHSEELSAQAITQLYSNGHVRNIKNLPAVNPNNIVSWWKLSSSTTPEEDSVGTVNLQYSKPVMTWGNQKYVNDTYRGEVTNNTNKGNYYKDVSSTGIGMFPSLDSSTSFRSSSSVSFSMYFKVGNTLATFKSIFSERYNTNVTNQSFFEIFTFSTGLRVYSTYNGVRNIKSYDNTLTAQTWYHLVVTTNTDDVVSGATVYLNGSQLTPSSSDTSNTIDRTNAYVTTVNIGGAIYGKDTSSSTYGSQSPTGTFGIDELTTWSKQLTSLEVGELYNLGSPINPTTHSASASLERYLRFGDNTSDGVNIYDDQDSSFYIQSYNSTDNVVTLTSSNPTYVAPPSSVSYASLSDDVIDADGATRILEEDQYGSGITMSLTKRFNTTTNEWTNVHTNETCVCLSFNGFEDQAEHFAIYTHDTIDIADNTWHNLVLSFSGREGSSTNSTTNFSFDTANHNFVLSIDGNPVTNAHFVGGLAGVPVGKSFPAQERYLKWDNNSEEDYIPHAQLNSNIFESINQTTQLHEPVKDRDYKTGFVGYADESSFHSESWFTDSSFNPTPSFNNEKVKTLFGSTNALTNRGPGSSFPAATPYPLRRPSVIGSSTSTGNQYIDPERYDAATNADGGLEAWWRWGDTIGDCSININNAIGFESGSTDTRRSLKLNGTYNSEENSVTGLLEDIYPLTSSDSIYVPEAAASSGGGVGISLVNVIIENVQAGVCNLKNLTSPLLQYIRVKFTNSGEAQLGEGKLEAAVHYRKRRER